MEYAQMTLDDWVQMKQKLKQELLGVRQSFVRIGYALRQIDDNKLYEQDGYKSIAEFAKAEYGLEPSTTSRFMSINKEYSVDGYSEKLLPEYADFGRSQLEEMLRLPEEDRQMIQPAASREDIRDLKRFNKDGPVAGVADDIKQLLENFYEENNSLIREIIGMDFTEDTIKGFVEIVNPSGNRSYKKGLFFLMMYEDKIVIKKFGSSPQNMTWWEFYQISKDILDDFKAPDNLPVEEKIGVAEATEESDEKEVRDKSDVEAEAEVEEVTEEETKEQELPAVAPAQISKDKKPTKNDGGRHIYTVQFTCSEVEYERLARWARDTKIKFKKISVK